MDTRSRYLGIKKRHLLLTTLDTNADIWGKKTTNQPKPNNSKCFLVFWKRKVKVRHRKIPLHNFCRLTMSVQPGSWSHFLSSRCPAQPPLSVCAHSPARGSSLHCQGTNTIVLGACATLSAGRGWCSPGLCPWFLLGKGSGERGDAAQMGFGCVWVLTN